MTEPQFIHLRLHSAYSLLEGAIPVKALPKLCAEAGMPAVALTDTGNLFAALEFSEVAAKAGIQPIIGCQLALAYAAPAHPGERASAPRPIVLLAQDATGLGNLMKLSSFNYLDCGAALPHVTLEALATHAAGLICLTGGAEGPLGQLIRESHGPRARALAERLAGLFPGRLYVEVQRHPENGAPRTPLEEATEPGLVGLAYELDLPLVATNDVQFADRAMHDAHDALICIANGAYVDQQEPRRRLTPEHCFKGADEMVALFADLPEAIANTVEIARRCACRPRKRKPILPKFAEDEVEELRRQARAGLAARLAVIPKSASDADYAARLEFELGVIEGMGFPGYFLIVADFIKWAKERSIPVGPGRGSGAGSLVAYALTITDLDPLRYGLLFERFLNPERISMPDFDIDFCMDRREEVIAYVQERYGRDRVAQIITFGALLSKAAVRDVGRVLQMPYGQVDRLSKLIPMEGVKPVSVQKALADEPRLREEARREPQVARLLEIAGAIEGLLRNASTHAAGVVIGDRPLVELVPLYRDPRSDMPATQFNMKWVEEAGLVKFDFLGLKTLTVIQNAVDLLQARGVTLDIGTIPLDDPKTYEVYASANTVAVFQVESSGMRTALRQLKPTCIEDIIALVALYRPGPMENIPKFCNVKNGREKRDSLHPSIDGILDETQGIIVYQEQVMEIARKLAGFSLGGADLLRRAMGKKIQAEMDAQKPLFLDGAKANGVSRAKAEEVWNLLDKFANYGFNKSHAAAYAVVSYQTAWLKANHPVEFMAAVMNCDIHLTDKLGGYKQEVDRLGIETVAPCVNRSAATFTVEDGRHRLCARRAEERRRRGDAADRRGARRWRSLRRPLRLRRSRRPSPRRQARARDAGPLRRAQLARFEPPQGLRRDRGADRLLRRRARGACLGPGQPFRRDDGRLARAAAPPARGLVADGAAGAGAPGDRLLPLRPPARRLRRGAPPRAGADLCRSRPPRCGGDGDDRQARRHRRRARPAQVGARHPLRLRPTLRPDRTLRGADVLRRPRPGPRPSRARPQRRPDRRGDGRGRRGPASRQGGSAHRRRGRRRRQRRPARLRRRRRRRPLARHPPRSRRPQFDGPAARPDQPGPDAPRAAG